MRQEGRWEGEKKRRREVASLHYTKWQLANVKRVAELRNHHFATITVKISLGRIVSKC